MQDGDRTPARQPGSEPSGAPRPLATLLPLAARSARSPVRSTEVALRALWPRIVGRSCAALTRVERLRGPVLVVRASTETCRKELLHLADHIVRVTNRWLGSDRVQRLIVEVGPLQAAADGPSNQPAREPEPGPAPERVQQAEQVAQVIADPELRELFVGWMARARPSSKIEAGENE